MQFYLKELNAHWCLAEDKKTQAFVYKILSYKDMVKSRFDNTIMQVTKSILDTKYMRFPSGLIPYITQKAKENGHSIFVTPFKYNKLPFKFLPKLPKITFEPYQRRLINKTGIHPRGILVASTGSGKSIVAGGIIAKLNIPKTIVIVPTKSILMQLVADFTKWFPEHSIGVFGNNLQNMGHITVASFQTLSKKNSLKKFKCELIIVDEAHRINKSIQNILKNLKDTYYRYGLTATPHRPQKEFAKAMNMLGCLGPILCEITDGECIQRVTDVDVYMIKFHCFFPKGANYGECDRKDVRGSDIRCKKILKAAKQMGLDKGKTVLILLDETSQALKLERIANDMQLNPHIVHSKLKTGHNENIKKRLNAREINLVIATPVFGIGTNIPNVDVVCLAGTRKAEPDTLQKIGRGRRRTENKDRLIVIDVIDRVRGKEKFYKHFYKHSMERMQIYHKKEWYRGKIYV